MRIEHLGPDAAELLNLSNGGEARSLNRLAELAAWQVPACTGAHVSVWREAEVIAAPSADRRSAMRLEVGTCGQAAPRPGSPADG